MKFLHDNRPDIPPQQSGSSELCKSYRNTDISSQDFHYNVRDGSGLRIDGSKPPSLRIGLGRRSEAAPSDIQIGFPILPEARSPIHFKLLREWLQVCDKGHQCHAGSHFPLPTRVLDVEGPENSGSLRLHCTKKSDQGRYIALSHCWGMNRPLTTTKETIKARCKEIKLNDLPKTFRDAVTVTQELGVRFLWIDSLCIIQDDPEDWDRESKKMETVFSSAYCTIAATSATDSTGGLLGPRSPGQCVKVPSVSDAPLCVCENIDNFHRDVEGGALSQRGWVLQERALSRRTIHFTKTQMYWECGKGVRCESLIKLYNEANLLGDSAFPSSAKNRSDENRTHLFQSLFKRYSKLALTYPTDRPVAISGLESRLVRAFNTSGSYGIFQSYLHRSILWQRSTGNRTKPIVYPSDRKVPSWSWMAYEGEISYIDIPFGEARWSSAVKWKPSKPAELQAPVRKFLDCTIKPQNVECAIYTEGADEIGWLRFDREDITYTQTLKCIVVGRAPERKEEQVHYILVVMQGPKRGYYERVGVGSIQGRHIEFEGGEFKARII